MEHYAPHPHAQFEGYYQKFLLPSKAFLVLIICSVHKAKSRPHLLSLTYCPASNDEPIYQQELYPESIEFKTLSSDGLKGFELNVPGIGKAVVNADSTTTYDFKHPSFEFSATTTSRVPWSSTTSTPESWLIYLPLPLHWHVHSLGSTARFSLYLPDGVFLPDIDRQGEAIVHQEKNWAHSFPSAHIWIQVYDAPTKRGLCLAGGQILGMEAWLIGYRNGEKGVELDFRPPFALKVFGLSPFFYAEPDWDTRSFTLSVQNFSDKLSIRAIVEEKDWDRFFGHSAPFSDGHRPNFLTENFRAKVDVEMAKKSWFGGSWQVVLKDQFEDAALEFGADYYPLRGEKKND